MSKVILKPWQREDAEPLATIANNRNVSGNLRDIFPEPYSVMDGLQWISRQTEADPKTNFAIMYDGKLAGSIGCIPRDDVYRKSIEIGYFIGEPFWGKGVATKAVNLLEGYITTKFDVIRIYAQVFAHNKASMRVLQKNGFYLEGIRRKAVVKNDTVMDDYIWVKLID